LVAPHPKRKKWILKWTKRCSMEFSIGVYRIWSKSTHIEWNPFRF
jgi:hypothetical protein